MKPQAKLEIEMVKTDDLVMYEGNAKLHPEEQVEQIAESIKEFNFADPIACWHDENGNSVIIEGHGRLIAARKLGIKELPVIYLDYLSDEQRRAYALVHNKLTMNSDFDFDILNSELDNIFEISMEEFGFDINKITEQIDQMEIEEDNVPDPPKEPLCKIGDIWQLGRHRLMCGDSTDVEVIDRLMDGVKADMVFTDPPYGMKKESKGVLNDNLNFDDLLDFNRQWIPLTFGALKDNGSWYCWGIDEPLMDIYSNILKPMAKENKITFRNLITWDKGNGQGEKSDMFRSFPIASEKCLFVMCGVQGFNDNSDNYFEGFEPIRAYLDAECEKCGGHKIWKRMLGNNMGQHYFTKSQYCFPTEEAYKKMQIFGEKYGAFDKQYEELKKQYEELKKQWYETRAYFNNTHDAMTDVWIYESNPFGETRRQFLKEIEDAGGHATPKPIALCSRAIKSSSREGETVLDVFGGSGSTLIACEQLNRKCYMIELDQHYCDVIIERWQNLTGEKAIKVESA